MFKLRDKLKEWLFKEEILKIQYIERELNKSIEQLRLITTIANKANNTAEEVYSTNEQIKELITPLLDIGTDIGFRDNHSWAVVCVKGKPEYVKFVPLECGETKEVINFLKRYQRSNYIIDSPIAFKSILDKELFI